MNAECKKYMKELKLLLPIRRKYEKKFLQNIKNDITELYMIHPDLRYEDICGTMGTPRENITTFFESIDTDYLMKNIKIAAILRRGIFCILLIILITCLIELGMYYNAYKEAIDYSTGYGVEIIE